MKVTECELCCNVRECIPNRHRMVCGDCSWAEMQDQISHEGLRVVENGRETTYRVRDDNGDLFCHPRAWNYR